MFGRHTRLLFLPFRARYLCLFIILVACAVSLAIYTFLQDQKNSVWARIEWEKSYLYTVYNPITVRRSKNAPQIAIISIVYDDSHNADYHLAEKTVLCYAEVHKYVYVKVNLKKEPRLRKQCPGSDLMFQRHCVVAQLMKENEKAWDWILFIDSDMGVVNPNHLLEEYIDSSADLVFYDRMYNYEIMAGSYLARNTDYARQFLIKWAMYEKKVIPNTFQAYSTDNGAIQALYLDEFCPKCKKRGKCIKIWEASRDFGDVFRFESCARALLGNKPKFKNPKGLLLQRTNGTDYWVRDAWVTDSFWGKSDFMFHGWKESKRENDIWTYWLSPFSNELFDSCKDPENGYKNWAYKNSLIKDDAEVKSKVYRFFTNAYNEHLKRWDEVKKLKTFN
ncbi:hypothetical protein M3Y97_00989200 [Aphelenchoides bicaudatus]|nr:hypothetical protein M3Y97_00989200 [Aphelenchoides bicaudatus]